VIVIGAMMFLSGPLANFINAHSTVVILCLSFLLTIGFSLFVEGFGFRIPKGYLYTAIAFAIMIEGLNQVARHKQVARAAGRDLRARTTDAVLRILRGASAGATSNEHLVSLIAARNAPNVFAPAERAMVRGVLSMADSPVESIMTPSAKVTWLDENDDPEALTRKILQSGHAAYPVCRGTFTELIGVARAPDLVRDLLAKKHIDTVTIDRHPLTILGDEPVLQLLERAHDTRVPMAIVRDHSGATIGVVTSIDVVQLIFGLQ
jgi:CBS domain containing-hemolysin-like protein